jgi:hypothetical protein
LARPKSLLTSQKTGELKDEQNILIWNCRADYIGIGASS